MKKRRKLKEMEDKKKTVEKEFDLGDDIKRIEGNRIVAGVFFPSEDNFEEGNPKIPVLGVAVVNDTDIIYMESYTREILELQKLFAQVTGLLIEYGQGQSLELLLKMILMSKKPDQRNIMLR